MAKTVPTSAAGYQVGEWMVRSIISGRQYRDVVRDQNRTYGDRGNRVASLFPIEVDGIPYFQTTSTTYTQTNALTGTYGEKVDLASFSPWLRVGRRLQLGGSMVLELEIEALIEYLDLRIFVSRIDGTLIDTVVLSSGGAGATVQRDTVVIGEAVASGGTLGNPLVQFGVTCEARTFSGGAGTGRLYAGPTLYERMLETTDAAKLPRGY